MMGIVTVLEGLLPSLPPAVILQQLVRRATTTAPCHHMSALRMCTHGTVACAHKSCMQLCCCTGGPSGSAGWRRHAAHRAAAAAAGARCPPPRVLAAAQSCRRLATAGGSTSLAEAGQLFRLVEDICSLQPRHTAQSIVVDGVAAHAHCAGVQGGRRAAGVSGRAASPAAAHFPLPRGAACCIWRCVQHQQPRRQHRQRAQQL